jgi:hypothetical protein
LSTRRTSRSAQRLAQVLDDGVGVGGVERGVGEGQLVHARHLEAGVGAAALGSAAAGSFDHARLDVDADDLARRD